MSVKPVLPRLSIQERDRRYRAVRTSMATHGIDGLLIPQNTGEWDACQADARYLTSIGGGGTALAVIFPLSGLPIAIVREPRRVEYWENAQDWVKEIRATQGGQWGSAMVDAVKELGLAKSRIGIPGLSGVLRFPDGTLTQGEYLELRKQLPSAEFENATGFMHEIRMVKSSEEIAMISRAQQCADAISEAIFKHAMPGVNEQELYAEMVSAHIKAGGEMPGMFLLGIGKQPNQTFLMPSNRKLEKNDILICESEIKYGGYMSQSIESVSLGTPPAEYDRLYELSINCFNHLLDRAHPGMSYSELISIWVNFMGDNKAAAAPTMGHGVGLGMDGPTTRPGGDGQGHVIGDGHCLILKPWATSLDGTHAIRAGNTVVMENGRFRRLGSIKMEFKKL